MEVKRRIYLTKESGNIKKSEKSYGVKATFGMKLINKKNTKKLMAMISVCLSLKE